MNKKIGLQIERIIHESNAKWQLFEPTDRVLFAISGGKDSLSLLSILYKYFKIFHTVHIALQADTDLSFLPFIEDYTKIKIINSDIMQEVRASQMNPCFICSRRRNQAIFQYAQSLNIKKVLFAHNRDDVIETLLMNMFYSSKISTMLPKQALFGGKIEVIRPLYEVPEILLSNYSKDIPVISKSCENDGNTKRAYVKELIKIISKEHHDIDINNNLYKSLLNIDLTHLPNKK